MAMCILHLYAQSNRFLNTEIDFIGMLLSHSSLICVIRVIYRSTEHCRGEIEGVGGLGCG